MIGQRIGRYRVARLLGEGGMGAVYEAVHEDIGQRAAVKVLHAALSREERFVQRFFDEARAVSKVAHPGLVKIFDFNRLPDGTLYILMEFLEGEPLRDRYERLHRAGRMLSPGEAARLCRQMASALQAVHDKGVVHRDLKPENVVIVADPDTPGGERAKLLDFGIAKLDDASRQTTVGMVLGTPQYMAPEQCEARPGLTDRVDVYALGVMLYEMLTGAAPFHGDTASEVMRQHLFRAPPPLPPGAPPPLAQLVEAMLAKDPAARPGMGRSSTASIGSTTGATPGRASMRPMRTRRPGRRSRCRGWRDRSRPVRRGGRGSRRPGWRRRGTRGPGLHRLVTRRPGRRRARRRRDSWARRRRSRAARAGCSRSHGGRRASTR